MAMPDPHRARVLWDKGQNFFSSFFVEIGNVRKEIPDDNKFVIWCFDELKLPLGAITRAADVLRDVDAKIVKQQLAAARAAEQAMKREERESRKTAQQPRPAVLEQELERTRRERDEARKEVELLRAQLVAAKKPGPSASNPAAEAQAKPKPEPKPSTDRHRPGYMAEYMRRWRAERKQRD
jgi:hypothetical protein